MHQCPACSILTCFLYLSTISIGLSLSGSVKGFLSTPNPFDRLPFYNAWSVLSSIPLLGTHVKWVVHLVIITFPCTKPQVISAQFRVAHLIIHDLPSYTGDRTKISLVLYQCWLYSNQIKKEASCWTSI